jgi:hypothetical protein
MGGDKERMYWRRHLLGKSNAKEILTRWVDDTKLGR